MKPIKVAVKIDSNPDHQKNELVFLILVMIAIAGLITGFIFL